MIINILKKRTALYPLALTLALPVLAIMQTNSLHAETLAENQAAAAAMAAQEPPPAPGKLKETPWHLVDLWWNLGTNMPFESYSIDVDIMDDVPTNINLYLSPVGFGKLNAAGFYGGLQTHADGHSTDNPVDRGIGRGLIFSRWDERDPTAVRPASSGGIFQSAGNEGDFVSVRAPYEWAKGRYTYRVVKMDHSQVHGQDGTWVGAFVYSYQRHENAFIGALWFKDNDLVLDKSIASFVEIYGEVIPVATVPTVRIRYENPTVNGKIISWPSVDGSFDKGIPDIADVQWKDGGIEISVNATNQIARPKRYYTIHQADTGVQ
jgi:hypothetical protein